MFRGIIRGARSRRAVEVRRALAGMALLSGLAACAGAPQPAARSAPVVAPPPAQSAASYAPPGPPSDPWGPYIREASTRFVVPEKWIREVMRQESGGHQYINGGLTTSNVGAMGLMQLMPVTYAQMRDRYGLGPDPYAPHDNILAGTAYIREMYARYGSPGFLAAYNAGPGRLDSYLVGGTPLPAETVGYLSSVAPRLGDASAPTGPLAHYAVAEASADDLNLRSLNGTLPVQRPQNPAIQMASYQVPASAPSGDLNIELQARATRPSIQSSPLAPYAPPPAPKVAYAPPPPRPEPARVVLASANAGALSAAAPAAGGWIVQVGAFSSEGQAQAAAADARSHARGVLDRARATVAAVPRANAATVYRAQLAGLSADAANEACSQLARDHVACLVVAPRGTF
jgi:hypothetical protein